MEKKKKRSRCSRTKKEKNRNARIMITHPRRPAAASPLLAPDSAATRQHPQLYPQLNAASKYDFVKASKNRNKISMSSLSLSF